METTALKVKQKLIYKLFKVQLKFSNIHKIARQNRTIFSNNNKLTTDLAIINITAHYYKLHIFINHIYIYSFGLRYITTMFLSHIPLNILSYATRQVLH